MLGTQSDNIEISIFPTEKIEYNIFSIDRFRGKTDFDNRLRHKFLIKYITTSAFFCMVFKANSVSNVGVFNGRIVCSFLVRRQNKIYSKYSLLWLMVYVTISIFCFLCLVKHLDNAILNTSTRHDVNMK